MIIYNKVHKIMFTDEAQSKLTLMFSYLNIQFNRRGFA